ncbi:hypothetical protein LTR37_015282 [Vermiconidia calcicola]|uniref:Uncharacterized protein n=1 Tax=Vermiconidia calcicola TaxID=1690605 RepID=A0ACC3MR49_9PEZI|nr:hypothetical protein LTR37_015282 [Vermiconidia calcicola]
MLMTIWFKKAFFHHWDNEPVLRKGTIGYAALMMLECMHTRVAESVEVSSMGFSMPVVSDRVDASYMVQSYIDLPEPKSGHLFDFGFLFDFSRKCFYFRTLNHLRMRKADSDAQKAYAIRSRAFGATGLGAPQLRGQLRSLEEHYLLLNVSRGNVLQDAFDQLWQRQRSELLRPVRVRLGEIDEFEVGHDLGGVQIEFFNLVSTQADMNAEMFTTDSVTGLSYFRAGSMQPLYMFELCGLLFGLAVYNGITLPVSLPRVFYMQLLGKLCNKPGPLSDGWPQVSRSLEAILEHDIHDLDFVFSLEANGLRLTVLPPPSNVDARTLLEVLDASRIESSYRKTQADNIDSEQEMTPILEDSQDVDIRSIEVEWPGWRLTAASKGPAQVTADNQLEYVRKYIKWLTIDSVAPQWHAFEKGFFSVIDSSTLKMLSPDDLRRIVEGSDHLDINELKRATLYTGYDPKSRYIQTFWRIVSGWPEVKQKQLVKFVTAAERIPAGGASNLTFRIEKAQPWSTQHLPTSSTCFGTLLLPKYPSADILDNKLSVALKYGLEGFGTG